MTQTKPEPSTFFVVHIEDNPAHARLIGRAFERHREDVEVLHISDGAEAARLLFTEPSPPGGKVSLILLDLRLPRVSGLELLEQLQVHPVLCVVPVVVLTTSNAPSDVASAYRHGANSYLVKPPEFAEIEAMVDDLIRYWCHRNHSPHEVES